MRNYLLISFLVLFSCGLNKTVPAKKEPVKFVNNDSVSYYRNYDEVLLQGLNSLNDSSESYPYVEVMVKENNQIIIKDSRFYRETVFTKIDSNLYTYRGSWQDDKFRNIYEVGVNYKNTLIGYSYNINKIENDSVWYLIDFFIKTSNCEYSQGMDIGLDNEPVYINLFNPSIDQNRQVDCIKFDTLFQKVELYRWVYFNEEKNDTSFSWFVKDQPFGPRDYNVLPDDKYYNEIWCKFKRIQLCLDKAAVLKDLKRAYPDISKW